MAYLVTCAFDLKSATRQDYDNAYADLEKIGLKKVVVAGDGSKVVAPTTVTLGEFNGQNAVTVRDFVLEMIKKAFAARGFSSEIFVVVGGDWTWGATSTR